MLLTNHPDLTEALLVMDDHLAYLVSDRLRIDKRFLLDMIIMLKTKGLFNQTLAIDMVQTIQSRYPTAFVEHTLHVLRR